MNEVSRRLPAPIRKVTAEFFLEGAKGGRGSLVTRLRRFLRSVGGQFIAVVMVPTLLATVYFGIWASDRYVSEAEYIVRGVSSSRAGGLSSLLQTFGISRAADDTAAVQDFLRSRDAVRDADKQIDLRKIYGRSGVDFLSRFPRFWEQNTFEALYTNVTRFVSVIEDPTKGITTLHVEAFSPEESKLVASTLLNLAEDMVNRMNERAQSDAIKNARDELARAEADVTQSQNDLTAFRNKQLFVDPTSYSTVLLAAVNKLSLDLVQTTANEKATLRMSPSNPALPSLEAQVESLNQGIDAERRKLGGSDTALSGAISQYEKMSLLRDLAGRRYAQALVSLDDAQQEAHRQQIYIEEVVRPNLADESIEPERLRSITTVFVLCFAVFAMLWILTVGAKDHAQ